MRFFIIIGAFFAMSSVILGAFAAHGLKQMLSSGQIAVFQTGVTYQMYHALALLGVSALVSHIEPHWIKRAGGLFITGIVFFSGSLYLLALTGMKIWGPITPIGGLLFIAGWFAVIVGAIKGRKGNTDKVDIETRTSHE